MPKMPRRKSDKQDSPLDTAPRRNLGMVTKECLRLSQEMRKGHLLEHALQVVTNAAVKMTRSHQATLRLLDDSGKRLLKSARTGPSVHRRGSSPFGLGEGFIGWVVVHQKPSIINRVKSDPRFVMRAGQKWTPSAIMAVPLMADRRCIGVLSVSRRNNRVFTKQDLDLLHLVAELSSPYLEIARLKQLNESDPLTLLHNRRHLQQRLPQEVKRARRINKPLSVTMADLDHFKLVNDAHGHDVGDEVLCDLAERLNNVCRASDVITRWGGEEFFIILPDTSVRQATAVSERIRKAVADVPFQTSAGKLWLSISLGVAGLQPDDDDCSLERRADQTLYKAKRNGRNLVATNPTED